MPLPVMPASLRPRARGDEASMKAEEAHVRGDRHSRLQSCRSGGRAGRRRRARLGAMVRSPDHARRAQGADAPRRRPGDPRHAHLVCGVHRVGRLRLLFLGKLGRGSVLCHLRRALRLVDRQPLARVRPPHRVQDAMDERRGLPDRLLHDHARAGDLALEPYAASYRHDHRWARSRDHHAAAAGRCVSSA